MADARPSPPSPPPGPRAARLADAYALALRRTLARLADDTAWAVCFPTPAARTAPALRQVQAQMAAQLAAKCQREFDRVLADRAVVARLNELEALTAAAAARRAAPGPAAPTPPHELPPERILAAHLAAALAPLRSLLNARLQTSQARNARLADQVRRQRAHLDALLARLESAVADLRGANRALARLAPDLARESREARVHLPP